MNILATCVQVVETTPSNGCRLTRTVSLFPEDARPAASLLLIYASDGEPATLLTKRSAALPTHRGQVSMPGGAVDPGHADPHVEEGVGARRWGTGGTLGEGRGDGAGEIAGQQEDDEERIAPVQHPQRRVEDRRAAQAGRHWVDLLGRGFADALELRHSEPLDQIGKAGDNVSLMRNHTL